MVKKPKVHWRWQTADGESNRHLCSTTEEERAYEEGSIILRPIDKATNKPPENECGRCAKLGAAAGIS